MSGKIDGIGASQLKTIAELIRNILPKAGILAFGSRVTGGARKYSDLDLALDNRGIIERKDIARIKEALSESDLPFLVDLVDLNAVDGEFRELILKNSLQID
ncbi:MAG: nucleotidyltransferase domain-containing protein [Deltaproteobacteria bacterium]|nr:nucleotidyltransferase domain-containing protein [Deltaproteobacteria bacterium]